jgi:hypothetical protein
MPPLGPIVDLRDDPRIDMSMAQQLGGMIGQGLAARRIKQEEQYNQLLQQQVVSVLSRAAQEDWTPDKVLDGLAQVPNMARTQYGRQMQQQIVMDQYKRIMAQQAANRPTPEGLEVSGGRYDEYGNFIPSYSRPRQESTGFTEDIYNQMTPEQQAAYRDKIAGRGSGDSAEIARLQGIIKRGYRLAYDDMGLPSGYEVVPGMEDAVKMAQGRLREMTAPKLAANPAARTPAYTVDPLAYEPAPERLPYKTQTGQEPANQRGEIAKTEEPLPAELAPYWEGLSDEDKANVRAALKNGYSIQEIIDAIKG